MIKTQSGSRRAPTRESSLLDSPGPAETHPSLGDLTGVKTQGAGFSLGIPGRFQWQLKSLAAFLMQFLDIRPDLAEVIPHTGAAVPKLRRDGAAFAATTPALSHLWAS